MGGQGLHIAALDQHGPPLDLMAFDDEMGAFRFHRSVTILSSGRWYQAVGPIPFGGFGIPYGGKVTEFRHRQSDGIRVVVNDLPEYVCVGAIRWFPVDQKERDVLLPLEQAMPRFNCIKKCAQAQ